MESVERKVFEAEGHSRVEILILPDLFGGRPAAYIHKVYTDSEHQGKGLASGLVREAIEYAKMKGCYKVFLVCREGIAPFYERFGFQKGQVEMRLKL